MENDLDKKIQYNKEYLVRLEKSRWAIKKLKSGFKTLKFENE